MRCEDVEVLLDAYADGELEGLAATGIAPAGAAAVEAHLDGCPACRAALLEVRAFKASVRRLPALAPREGDLERALAALPAVATRVEAPPPATRARPPRRFLFALEVAASLLLAFGIVLSSLYLGPGGVSLAYVPGLFARYDHERVPFEPALEPVAPEPALLNVAGAGETGALRLTREERRRLAEQGVLGRTPPRPLASDTATRLHGTTNGPRTFADIYAETQAAGLPTLLTADVAVLAFAGLVAAVEDRLAAERIAPDSMRLLATLEATLAANLSASTDPDVHAATYLAIDYVAIGRTLLGDRRPEALSTRARAELERVLASEGVKRSPLTGEREDYTAYGLTHPTPRGMRRRALAWLARERFPLDRPEGARAALVLTHALFSARDDGPALERYERIRAGIAFFEGAPDGYDPERLVPALRRTVGESLRLADLAGGPRARALLESLSGLPPGEIPGPNGTRPFFSLLGPRYGAEAAAIARLTWPHVGTRERPRTRSTGLDVLVAAGLPGARSALDATPAGAYPDYGRALEPVAADLAPRAALASRDRDEDLFWLVHAARLGLEPERSSGYPFFATTEAARARRLGLALASLDIVALGQGRARIQDRPASPAASDRPGHGATGDPPGGHLAGAAGPAAPPAPEGFVEPAPELFARLASLSRALARALAEGVEFPSRERLSAELRDLAADLDRLAAAARASLEGRPVPAEAAALVRDPAGFAARRAAFPPSASWTYAIVLRPEGLATFHHRIVRGPVEVLAVVPRPGAARGELVLARGAGLFAEEVSSERRLSPEDVEALPRLPPPVWARPFLVEVSR